MRSESDQESGKKRRSHLARTATNDLDRAGRGPSAEHSCRGDLQASAQIKKKEQVSEATPN